MIAVLLLQVLRLQNIPWLQRLERSGSMVPHRRTACWPPTANGELLSTTLLQYAAHHSTGYYRCKREDS